MKSALILASALFASFAIAADLTGTVTVSRDGKQLFSQTNTFTNLSDADVSAMKKGATAQLDAASKGQDKGGNYTMTFQWAGEPAVETRGLKANTVHQSLRTGLKWLEGEVVRSEGKNK